MHLMPLNCTLKNGNFYVIIFYHNNNNKRVYTFSSGNCQEKKKKPLQTEKENSKFLFFKRESSHTVGRM